MSTASSSRRERRATRRSATAKRWRSYEIENGPRYGEIVKLGFHVPDNWPVEPPHGPCYFPPILRGTGLPGVHSDGRHFGPDWDHWSRRFEGWARTDHSFRAYMRHIRKLHGELPAREQADAE